MRAGFWDVLTNRRSIRSFSPGKVEQESIERVLFAATLAPSAGNLQPWYFYVVLDPEIKERLVDATYPGISVSSDRHQDWLRSAPVLIVVCADLLRSTSRYDRMGQLWLPLQDCSAAIENMLLTITHLGLASCWVGGFRVHEVMETLKIPSHLNPVAIVPVGVPGQSSSGLVAPARRAVSEVSCWV